MNQQPGYAVPQSTQPAPLGFAQTQALQQPRSLVGAKVLGATIEAPPLLGYYFAILSDAARKRVLEAIADQGANLFTLMMDAAMGATGLIKPEWHQELAGFRSKTPELWAEQRAKYPDDYTEDMNRYNRLIEREQNEP